MRTPMALALAASLLVGMACQSRVKIATDFDPAFDFTRVQSYAWLDERSGVMGEQGDVNTLLDRRIRGAIDAALLDKGLAFAERDAADILVSYHIGVEQKLDVNTIHTGYGYGAGWYGGYRRPYGYGGVSTQTYVDEYQEGTLLIDLVEPGNKQLVWRGSGQARVSEVKTPEEREKRVRDVVTRMLSSYPPASKE